MKKKLVKFLTFICAVSIFLPTLLPLSNTVAYANSWDQLEPYSIIEDGNNIEYVYKVSEEELAEIEQYYGSSSLMRTNGTTYGSFNKPGTVVGIAGAIISIAGMGTVGGVIGIAGMLVDLKTDVIYYSYTQSSWRESNGRFHVTVRMNFYSDASYSNYVTGTTFTRTYEVWE